VVDVVALHHDTGELLKEIGLFVGDLAACDGGEAPAQPELA